MLEEFDQSHKKVKVGWTLQLTRKVRAITQFRVNASQFGQNGTQR
jgi:hypothetical protein